MVVTNWYQSSSNPGILMLITRGMEKEELIHKFGADLTELQAQVESGLRNAESLVQSVKEQGIILDFITWSLSNLQSQV